jgi:hypothetical protein
MRHNKRASKDIGTDDIRSKSESTKRLKSNGTCGLAVADIGMCKSVGGDTQNVYEENDICSEKASELIQIPGDREKVSEERRKIRQKAS